VQLGKATRSALQLGRGQNLQKTLDFFEILFDIRRGDFYFALLEDHGRRQSGPNG
jgi:hypothetical protein